ncbi:Ig-like domain-containing protein [Streptomyces sp. LP05-1]|uniref:Ig-like domain-containing protein n=1 Tax=Streptomyces pyxinae TaxID=2970734 RepID=A0ABT2C9Q3_9ACTN|nr:Ig-like domain-containing protein [Streptomyces sp. LP05-1]MCS0634138.1 Ig-like domain-containing protein [Streptomyces sp. LP05-1]
MRNVLKRAGRAAAVALTGVVLAAGAAGCTGGGLGLPFGDKGQDDETIRVTPDDRAKDVAPDGRLEVTVEDGRLERVVVTRVEDAQRAVVPGTIARDGRSWRPSDGARLSLAAKYTVDAVALDGDGRRAARHTTFTTAVPERRFIGYFSPEHRSTVGTGMIVSFGFSRPISDRAAVERAIRITSDPPVEVAGHWFGRERLDFRPSAYWEPGTRVTLDLRLRDVQGAPGVYGIQDRTVTFTVGRSQVSRVDAEKHFMEVRRDGDLVSTVPITAGAPKSTTYNGKMVVTELYDVTRMNGATVGFTKEDGKGEYDIKDVPHAMRLTDSGTFLHGNYWAAESVFGKENVSHGCVGLRDVKGGGADTPAGWFFDRTLVGDVVEVVNSPDRQVAPDNGLGGWNMSWTRWKAGSAVRAAG